MQTLSRRFIEGFYAAYISREPARIGPLLDENVEWSISGPVELLGFFGPRRGKAAILELVTSIVPRFMDLRGFEIEELLIHNDRVAAFNRLHAVQCKTGRLIAYRCAHFMHFRNSRLVSLHAVCDSFDAAEQMVGHAINVGETGEHRPAGDLIAI
ncbi:MAG: nuclear transport factor 2 family protein [Rhizobiales bacterium]|nr:nuclear transport factor 2 family protein [Hyphomicrobiales bacterium]